MKVTGIIFAIAVFGVAVLVGTAGAEPMSPGMKAWGERLQGEARVYQQLQLRQLRGTTALGLEAWGKRLQAEVGVYRQLQQEQGCRARLACTSGCLAGSEGGAMYETYSMLGREHEADLAREAARRRLAASARPVGRPWRTDGRGRSRFCSRDLPGPCVEISRFRTQALGTRPF
jgi:hypothetical protein